MTDELLTPDALAAIEARAEALEKLFPSTVYPHRDPDIYYSVVDAWGDAIFSVTPRFLGPEDVEAARNAIFEAATDIPALLAHADALAAEVARLRGDRRAMHDALLTLVSHIHMRAHPSNRMKWVCPYCKGTHKSLTALEEGEGHTESCPYAAARRALDDAP